MNEVDRSLDQKIANVGNGWRELNPPWFTVNRSPALRGGSTITSAVHACMNAVRQPAAARLGTVVVSHRPKAVLGYTTR